MDRQKGNVPPTSEERAALDAACALLKRANDLMTEVGTMMIELKELTRNHNARIAAIEDVFNRESTLH